jgi:Zn-dependent protease
MREIFLPKSGIPLGVFGMAALITYLILAALFGILVNGLALAFLALGGAQGMPSQGLGGFVRPLLDMLLIGVQINVMLAIFNLLPVPPMDGSKLAISLLPMPYAGWFARLERYGFLPLLILFFIPATNHMIGAIVNPIEQALSRFFVDWPRFF